MADFIDFILVGVRHDDATSCGGLVATQSAKASTSQTVDDPVMLALRITTTESRLACIQYPVICSSTEASRRHMQVSCHRGVPCRCFCCWY